MILFPQQVFSCCCIGSSQSEYQITCSPHVGLDEGILDGTSNAQGCTDQSLRIPLSSEGRFPPRQWTESASTVPGPPFSARSTVSVATAGSTATTARSRSVEEKQQEKDRLQDMVKEFAKSVVQGLPCHWLPDANTGTAHTAAPLPAQFSLDKALGNFSVKPQEGDAVAVSMNLVTDVVKDIRSTPLAGLAVLQPPHMLAGEELDRRFVCLRYEVDGAQPLHIGLLLPNQHERERFYTCMTILRWAIECKKERC
mmetsp:Transcript_112867/g.319251  ORF Transcript_112867/g.319251 Transcript_112867/m.319251 type:complete len:254 (-) Transcript_112867:167-928(-)